MYDTLCLRGRQKVKAAYCKTFRISHLYIFLIPSTVWYCFFFDLFEILMQLITKFVQSNIDYQLNFQIRKLAKVEYDGLFEGPHNPGKEVNAEIEIVGYVILKVVLIHNLADEGISLQLGNFDAEVRSMSVVPKGYTF